MRFARFLKGAIQGTIRLPVGPGVTQVEVIPDYPTSTVIPGLDPGTHFTPCAKLPWVPGSSPRLSGLALVDRLHGIDSTGFRALAGVLGHEKGSTPCVTTIAYCTDF